MFLNCLKNVSEFGNDFFDTAFGFLFDLPGVIKGIAAIVILTLMAIGALSLLKKSLKIFGILISLFLILILVGILLNK